MLSQVGDAPAIFSAKHNLLDSGNRKSSADSERWENGISFIPEGCFVAHVQEVDCPPNLKHGFQDCPEPVTFLPFTVTVDGAFTAHEEDGILEHELEVKTSAAVERAIAEGVLTDPTNPNFTDFTAVALATGDGNAVEAVGIAEARLLELGQQGGTIHMSPVEAAQCKSLVFEDGGNLYTKTLKSKVIVGNYTPGTVFIHGGDVDVYIGDEFVNASYEEISTNRFIYIAEVLVLVTWNPCFGFKVTIADAPLTGYSAPLTAAVLES